MELKEAKAQVIEMGQMLLHSNLTARTWGNISCRINDHQFVITPSGCSYEDLTPERIVIVNIIDEKPWGYTIPSVEKGIHLDIYKLRPDVNAVVHTHQTEASALSAMECGLPAKFDGAFQGSVRCGLYGFPGSDELRENFREELFNGTGNAILLAHHGAVCCGEDLNEAFRYAYMLERTCEQYILESCQRTYGDKWHENIFIYDNLFVDHDIDFIDVIPLFGMSRRLDDGIEITLDSEVDEFHAIGDENLISEIFKSIFEARADINYIKHVASPELLVYSALGENLPTYIDDFAQINGPEMVLAKIQPSLNPADVVEALGANNGVLLSGAGAFCCGKTESDVDALAMVAEKNAHARLIAGFFPGKMAKTVPLEDCEKMRKFYLEEYSKRF